MMDIKHRITGAVIYSADVNTMRDAVEMAVRDDVSLSGAHLTGAYLTGAYLSGAHLSGAYLSGAHLSGAYLTGADFTKAYLIGAHLTAADFTGAYLCGAHLTGADFTRAYLSGAHLTGAKLTGADLTGAHLTGADFTGAHLTGACIGDHALDRWIAQLRRSDGYGFLAFATLFGETLIRAGCHTLTLPEYRAHVSAQYPGTDKARETTDILNYIERRATA